MADDASSAAAIAGSAQLASTAVNAWSAASTNKKQRKWSEQMYQRQLADNQAQWHQQNEYNSPTSQMARLREAGLNPHLVYGKGADNVASNMSMPSAPQWNPKAPQIDLASPLHSYYDARIKDAQYDNLKVANTVQLQEAALKAAQTEETIGRTTRNKFDLDLAKDLRIYSMDAAREGVRAMQANTAMQLSENERRDVMQRQNLQESVTRIAQMRSQMETNALERGRIQQDIERIRNGNTIQKLEIGLKQKGLTWSDPLMYRVAGVAVNAILDGTPPETVIKKAVEETSTFLKDNPSKKVNDWIYNQFKPNK